MPTYKVSSVCSQEATACFTSASVTNCLLVRSGASFAGPKRWKSLGSIPPTGRVTELPQYVVVPSIPEGNLAQGAGSRITVHP